MHENWEKAGFVKKIAELAARRTLKDLTMNPIMTWSNVQIKQHVDACLAIPGAKVLFGGKALTEAHTVPACYGTWEATAVFIPLKQIMANE